ncbi:MAG: FixH family protein, partial [Deltaproteobacteria bacterium]
LPKPFLFLFILVVFSTVTISYARDLEVTRRAGEYEAQFRINRYPPLLGDNHIEIEVKDARGKPVTDAKVLVNDFMPPMPGLAPMNYTADAKLKGEKYKAKMNFITSGPWIIAIKINHAGKTSTAKFNVDAQ